MRTTARLTRNIAGTLALSLALPGVPLRAQDQPAPVIRTTTRLVQLNVVVLDNHKQPVGNLSQADFEVLDNGREQKLSYFSVSSTVPSAARSAPEPLVLTNRPAQSGEAQGTVTIVMVDELIDEEISAAYYRSALQSTRLQVLKFLGTLRPGQQVALYALSTDGVAVLQDLTDDSAALIAAAKTIGAGQLKAKFSPVRANPDTARGMKTGGRPLAFRKTDITEDLRRELVGKAFQSIAHHLQGTPARKNVVWISSYFPSLVTGFDPQLMMRERDAINPIPGAKLPIPEFADPQGHFEQMRDFARRLSNDNISIYPIDTKGLPRNAGVAVNPLYTGPFIAGVSRPNSSPPGGPGRIINDQPAIAPPNPSSVSGLLGERAATDLVAAETGGRAFYDDNRLDEDLRQVLDEGRVSYLVGYYPGDVAWDGKYHKVEVKLRRRELSVFCRKGYFAADEPQPQNQDTALREASKGMLEWSGMEVTLNVSSNPLEWFEQDMVVKLDPREIHFENKDGRWRAQLDMVFAQLAKDGRILESVKDHLDLALFPESYNEAATQGWFYPKTVDVDPKAEKLRVVVRDLATGATGSVSVPISHHKGA